MKDTNTQTISKAGGFVLPSSKQPNAAAPAPTTAKTPQQRTSPATEPEAKTSPICASDDQPSDASVTGFVPRMVSRSQIACWMSLMRLIEQNPGNAWLWTFTFADVIPFHWAGNIHRNFTLAIAHAQKGNTWPKHWGAVKVAEEHESGHGVHFHWLAYPRLNIRYVMAIAQSVGFGRINVHPAPATPKAATYLAKYLTKGAGMPGMKSWSCLGEFVGTRVQDVHIDSPSINAYRTAYHEAIAAGKPKGAAFVHAKDVQRKFDTTCDE